MKNKYNFTPIKILNSKEKKEIIRILNKEFGIEEIPGIILKKGAERLFLYQGSLSPDEIRALEEKIIIERVGVYFATLSEDKRGEEYIRLSIEGSQLLKNQIKNFYELPDSQVENWMMGRDLDIKVEKKGFIIIKNHDDILGCGKASENKISNFIPKNRRLKDKTN